MSGPNEYYPLTGHPNDDLIPRLKGENAGGNIAATRSLPKSNSEKPKNTKDAPLNTNVPSRSSGKTAGTGSHNGSGERFETSSTAETKVSSLGTERPPSALEAELNSTLMEACATADKLETSKTECKHLQEQNAQLRRQLEEAQKNLTDAQDFIFSLQRREQKITESEAAKEFNSLCMSVEDWVQTKLGDAIEKRLLKNEATISGPLTRKLLSFIPQPGKEAFQYPDTDEYNVIAAIMNFLCIEIFDRDFYCPIEPGAMELLISIERSMRNLEPRRDLITWRSWHSETFTAITKRHEFAKQRQLRSAKLSADLVAMMELFLPRSDHRRMRLSVQSTIIEPALQLAHKMHLSVNKFTVVYTSYHGSKREKRHPLPRDSSPFECVTISPPGKVLKFPVSEGAVTYLFDLSPELVCKAVKTDSYGEPRVLKRARVLVAVTKDGETFDHATSLPSREPPTLLGWMEEGVYPKPTVPGKMFDRWKS